MARDPALWQAPEAQQGGQLATERGLVRVGVTEGHPGPGAEGAPDDATDGQTTQVVGGVQVGDERLERPAAAMERVASYDERLYSDVQLAARRSLASMTLEEILTNRNQLSEDILRDVQGVAAGYGVEILMELTRQKSVHWRGAPR